MKGIVLAGGLGTRLHPLTASVSKQLLPVYDRPMIYYPLSTLASLGISEVLVITNPQHLNAFQMTIGSGFQFGMQITYASQAKPNGIAEALLIARDFIGNQNLALVLGDNIFLGETFQRILEETRFVKGARIFAIEVDQPQRYGVVTFDAKGKVERIDEKPKRPKSRFAIPGLYFFDCQSIDFAKSLIPSKRGELEITEIHNFYLQLGQLEVTVLPPDTVWFDAGTPESLFLASQTVRDMERKKHPSKLG